MTTPRDVELPSYLRLLPAAVCAGCGRSALDECRDDLQPFDHFVCVLCAEQGITSTPYGVGSIAGQAVGRMFFAAKDLLIELLDAIEYVKEAGPVTEGAMAAELAAPPPNDPLNLGQSILTVAHVDGLAGLVDELRHQIALLEPLSSDTPEERRAAMVLIKK